MDEYETLKPPDVGLQIPAGLHSEVSAQNSASAIEEAAGRGFFFSLRRKLGDDGGVTGLVTKPA